MISTEVLFAFGLTVFAGLATGIGSAIAFFIKTPTPRFLSVALGFSGGVMIYVSLIEIMTKARDSLSQVYGETGGAWAAVAGFFGGMIVIALIDRFIPASINPHEIHCDETMGTMSCDDHKEAHKKKSLLRMGTLTALAIGIHNFPEGLATFLAALENPTMGIAIAVAIAIHNIPEGISVSVPIYYATGSRRKAFGLSFLSGLAEPVGVIIGYSILRPFMNDAVFGVLFASVAGIMVFISLDELLPTAREYGSGHLVIYGVMSGMAVMAASLLLFL
ncbi:MAG: zinc transporter ZupT [Spirochaetes bacterium]|nr:zinc transporter ZupT [Spirochaetota bacterium]MBU0954246.1 zinc transporter ZupT [Spirochaetota bacterium]